MREFVCCADIHLWIKKDVPEEWQVNRYMQLFESLINLCKEHDAGLFIAGDFFERADPTQEEIQLALVFFRQLKEAGIRVYLISGNHETLREAKSDSDLGECTFDYLDAGLNKTLDICYGAGGSLFALNKEDCAFHFVNYHNLRQFAKKTRTKKELQDGGSKLNILVTHFRCTVNQFIKEEVDVEALIEPFDLCIAGDIHQPLTVGKLVYTNNPINKEFEREVECGVVLLSIHQGTFEVRRIPMNLPALRQINIKADEPLPELNKTDFYRVEIEGTIDQLKGLTAPLDNVKLIKVPVVDEVLATPEEEETACHQSLEQELLAYMQELKYHEKKINDMLAVFKEA
jgi:DNA repair exonuclease SbcCD nuclease subunit